MQKKIGILIVGLLLLGSVSGFLIGKVYKQQEYAAIQEETLEGISEENTKVEEKAKTEAGDQTMAQAVEESQQIAQEGLEQTKENGIASSKVEGDDNEEHAVLEKEEDRGVIENEEENKAVLKSESQLEGLQVTEAVSQASSLEGKIICIDAGHQGKGNSNQEPVGPGSSQTKARVTSGTRGVSTGKYEYELNLEVALKLKAALQEKGVQVHMVRETHDVDISNKERAQLANEVGADLSLRLHADGSENSSVTGFSILVPDGSFVSGDVIAESKAIGDCLESHMANSMPNCSRGVIKRSDLSGFNWSEVPAVLIEMGFMSNPEEDEMMSTTAFQDTLVDIIVEALEAYYA